METMNGKQATAEKTTQQSEGWSTIMMTTILRKEKEFLLVEVIAIEDNKVTVNEMKAIPLTDEIVDEALKIYRERKMKNNNND